MSSMYHPVFDPPDAHVPKCQSRISALGHEYQNKMASCIPAAALDLSSVSAYCASSTWTPTASICVSRISAIATSSPLFVVHRFRVSSDPVALSSQASLSVLVQPAAANNAAALTGSYE